MSSPRSRVLVIGGAGFVGSQLVRQLETTRQLAIFDKRPPAAANSQVAFYQGDVRSVDQLIAAMHDVTEVINLAAEHQDNVRPASLYTEVNVVGSRNVCAAASVSAVKRIIFTSSVSVYGSQSLPMDESAQHLHFNEYGRSKHLAELEYEKWLAASADHQLTIVRPTVIFGPGNRGNVYNLLRQIKHGPFVMFGDGTNVKSIAHVDNVAAFLAFLTLRAERHGLYNYADKPDFTVRDLVRTLDRALGRGGTRRLAFPEWMGLLGGKSADVVSSLIGRPLPISEVRVRKFCSSSEIDAQKAFSTGFVPPTDLETGLRIMIRDHV